MPKVNYTRGGKGVVGVGCGLDSAYERGGEARRKFRIQPLKENDLGVAQAFLTPKRDHAKTRTIYIYLYFFACNPI